MPIIIPNSVHQSAAFAGEWSDDGTSLRTLQVPVAYVLLYLPGTVCTSQVLVLYSYYGVLMFLVGTVRPVGYVP